MAHYGGVRSPPGHGALRACGLCWDWVVSCLPYYVYLLVLINWLARLISASVGTIVYYGFQGHDSTRNAFLYLCLIMGVAGSVVPFMSWFNDRKYRVGCNLLIMD